MVEEGKKRVILKEGQFTMPSTPDEQPRLIGSRCRACGEYFFPKQVACAHCFKQDMEEVLLSPRGKLWSYTIVRQRPPVYQGPVPYALGLIELPEIRIEALLTDCDFDSLKVGMDMELVIEKLHEDEEGNEVLTWKFRPVGG